ncbi:M3 family oligoendopeptidase [Pontibacter sp. BT310]|uniref:M3 family oligoendopeptidase n=1 Tax=Pontibacter populi TaxID=890055 RepID=A0ABS6XBX3_9BACT|nr:MULTISPECIES: M3 family oligoendopeptidase [Pontibacter]MBJ6118563.1 M3 family oligoendopeptidase [Pontibacter sp. BT310]MBR0570992.1 M3 family oligoendopeptidase [Microvirga sp. STS03]MBW3365417.1 M3 family oligoendopeptidase [Pontibacter populi]
MTNVSANLIIPKRKRRTYLPEDFKVETWEALQPSFEELKNREITNVEELERWMADRSELESMLSEDMGWRYIRMTCDTQNEESTKAFQYFVSEIDPKIAPYDHELNKKLMHSPYVNALDKNKYRIYLRGVERALEIFREENIPLNTEISTKQQQYAAITGTMTVTLDGEEMTLQRAADRMKQNDRTVRETAWRTIQDRRIQDKDKLDELFNELLKLRTQVAKNADFDNFRDYMFAALGRFDYTPQDCFDFHTSIKETIVPLLTTIDQERKQKLGVDELKPWDLDVDPSGRKPLEPFTSGEELLEKTVQVFYKLDTYLGDCLATMRAMGHLDLESRKGKAPGGYNYPLDEIGVPFIFMNATTSLRDVITMLHEGGHAVHSFLTRELTLNSFKHPPSEVAELASMSMELISMDYWDTFFDDEDELRRAKKSHLESVLETFPWVATVDKFQHWIYEHPEQTTEERKQEWVNIFDQFNHQLVDWTGLEQYKPYMWQKQLHIFEVPFYYVEYAMAQLGAIAVWKNYKENPAEGLAAYKRALSLGYTVSIGEVYEAAGIKFDFSTAYIKSLVDFVQHEMEQL